MGKDLVSLSKFLAVILRHQPERFGIELDEEGFADVELVWEVIQTRFGSKYQKADLATVVEGDRRGKKRYDIVGTQIRAMYGHSKPSVIYPTVTPPDILYHGTNIHVVDRIQDKGLLSLGRQYVHMTTNYDNALHVAARQSSEIIILTIHAHIAHEAGIIFHQAEEEHYLARKIPPEFIVFPEI